MPVTLTPTRLPADATQQADLRGLFNSSGFTILKEMVAARCAEHQMDVMQALLYPENEKAKEVARLKTEQAVLLNALLDMLDDISKNEKDWFTVRTEMKVEYLP